MTGLLVAVAAVVALFGAARSTWSPCGLSMMSTITPFGERARGHRYAVTASWFVVGATIGGLTSGAVAAGLAKLVAVSGLAGHPGAVGMVGGFAALLGSALDSEVFGRVMPLVRRQVDDGWVGRYRPWVYGSGFGWQIGTGFATYLMTAAVPVWAALGVLTGSPALALLLGGLFGLARGLTVFLTAGARSPQLLYSLHGRIDAVGRIVRIAVAVAMGAGGGALAAAAVVGAKTAGDVVVVVCTAVVAGAAGAFAARRVVDACPAEPPPGAAVRAGLPVGRTPTVSPR
jgi:hypothetical protein